MADEASRVLTSRDFGVDSFQHTVLDLRERCLKGDAGTQQVNDWRHLADWLGCGDGPFTQMQAERLKTARIAFLRAANGSAFDEATLPPAEIREIFERLSPAALAIEKLKSKGKATEKVPPKGVGRQNGALVGGLIVFGLILAIALRKGAADLNVSYMAGQAMFPAIAAALIAAVWRGGPDFRPLKDGLMIAAIADGLEAMSETGSASFEAGHSLAPAVACSFLSLSRCRAGY